MCASLASPTASALQTPTAEPCIRADIQDFFSRATIEGTCRFNFQRIIDTLAEHGVAIPAGMVISIVDKSSDPGSVDADRGKTAEQAAKLVELGYTPMVHLAARRIKNGAALADIKSRMTDAGVTRYLLLAGDPKIPAGDFKTAMDLARTGLFDGPDTTHICFAGHPYGNPMAPSKTVWRELHDKDRFSEDHPDIETSIISQVCYTPWLFRRWVHRMRNEGIAMPVRAGILLGDIRVKLDFAKTTFIPPDPLPDNLTTRGLRQIFRMVVTNLPEEMRLGTKGKGADAKTVDISEEMVEDMLGVTLAMGSKKALSIGLAHLSPGARRDMTEAVPNRFITSLVKGSASDEGIVVAPHIYRAEFRLHRSRGSHRRPCQGPVHDDPGQQRLHTG